MMFYASFVLKIFFASFTFVSFLLTLLSTVFRNFKDTSIVPVKLQTLVTLHQFFGRAFAGASTPLKHGRSLRPWKNEGERKSCIFSWKLGGKIKGEERLNYLNTYLHCFPLFFLKNFLACSARSLTYYFHPPPIQGTRNIIRQGR